MVIVDECTQYNQHMPQQKAMSRPLCYVTLTIIVPVTVTLTVAVTVSVTVAVLLPLLLLLRGVQELLQAGPHGISQAVAQLLEGAEQQKRDALGRTLSMARLSSRNSQGGSQPQPQPLAARRMAEVHSMSHLEAHGLQHRCET